MLRKKPVSACAPIAPERGAALGPLCRAVWSMCFLLLASACALPSADGPDLGGGPVAGSAVSKTAMSAVGTRYRYGGASPAEGFDCSGLVCWSYGRYGVSLPRTAREQSRVGASVGKSGLKPGDLVVFHTGSGVHTGIYTGQGKFVHSPGKGKTVRVDSMESAYWKSRFAAGRRLRQMY